MKNDVMHPRNEEIYNYDGGSLHPDTRVTLIDAEKKRIGKEFEYTIAEALAYADSEGLDLVLMYGGESGAVCKVCDYNRERYIAKKSNPYNPRIAHEGVVKEIRLTPNMSDSDYATKRRKIQELLDAGYTVKLSVQLRRGTLRSISVCGDPILRMTADVSPIRIVTERSQSVYDITSTIKRA